MIQTITNFILCNYYLLPQYAMHGKESLENKIHMYHKKGLCLKKDCVMNITVLRREYEDGCRGM